MVDKNKTGRLAAFDNHVVRRQVAMDEAGSMEPRNLFPQCLQQRALVRQSLRPGHPQRPRQHYAPCASGHDYATPSRRLVPINQDRRRVNVRRNKLVNHTRDILLPRLTKQMLQLPKAARRIQNLDKRVTNACCVPAILNPPSQRIARASQRTSKAPASCRKRLLDKVRIRLPDKLWIVEKLRVRKFRHVALSGSEEKPPTVAFDTFPIPHHQSAPGAATLLSDPACDTFRG